MFGAVVVLYNPTLKEIENINNYTNQVEHVVVIDNSDTNNIKLIHVGVKDQSNVIYIPNMRNLGLAKAFNMGVEILFSKKCEWSLLLDADSIIPSDIIEKYSNVLNQLKTRDKIAVLSPVHLFDRSKNKIYFGCREIDWSMTSGCLYNNIIFKKQKGFFEELFVDGIDMDYCFKSIANGYTVIECGQIYINHSPAETKKILWFKYGIASPFRYFMQARQLIWCWYKYHRAEALLIYIYKLFKVIFLFPNKVDYIKEVFDGTREGISLFREDLSNET